MKNIAVFSSGNGTNTENIITFFKNNPEKGIVSLVITNNSTAKVIERAKRLNTETLIFNKDTFSNHPEIIIEELEKHDIDLIVLAGFMVLVPEMILDKYEKRIINIHPSLLPKYGGKGMFGLHVHQSVIEAREKKSGITIHYIDKEYDRGDTIIQVCCNISENDTPEILEKRIHTLEYRYYPLIISKLLNK